MTALAPRIGKTTAGLLADVEGLHRLIAEDGSPVSVVLPDVFAANATSFGKELTGRGLAPV